MAGSTSIERFTSDTLHPAIPALGISRQRSARPGLGPHHHPCHELCLIGGGPVDWYVDGESVRLEDGDAFLTRPGEEHGAEGRAIQPCTLRWIQIDLTALDAPSIVTGIEGLAHHRWRGAQALVPHLDAILDEHRHPRGHGDRVVRAALDLLLVGLLRLDHGAEADELPGPVLRVLDDMRARLDAPPSVPVWANLAGVGSSRLHELFKHHLGRTPVDQLHRLRCDRARHLLRDGHSVTDIAMALGYSSSQHFGRTFKRFEGCSPSAWRARSSDPLA